MEHNMRVLMELAHRIHCLARGRLLASGTPDEIRADPRVINAYLGARSRRGGESRSCTGSISSSTPACPFVSSV